MDLTRRVQELQLVANQEPKEKQTKDNASV